MANAWKKVRRRPPTRAVPISAIDDEFAPARTLQLRPITSYAQILSMLAKQKRKCALLFVCHKSSLADLKSVFPGMTAQWIVSVHMEKMALFFFDNKKHMMAFSSDLHKRVGKPTPGRGMRWWCADHEGEYVYY